MLTFKFSFKKGVNLTINGFYKVQISHVSQTIHSIAFTQSEFCTTACVMTKFVHEESTVKNTKHDFCPFYMTKAKAFTKP